MTAYKTMLAEGFVTQGEYEAKLAELKWELLGIAPPPPSP